MDCYYCQNYKSDYGSANSSYCKAFQATLNDKDNPRGAEEFMKYYKMNSKATDTCPNGSHSKDYD